MAPPIVAGLLSGGAFTAAAAGVRRFGSRAAGWLGRNTGRTGAGAGGFLGGFGTSEIFQRLGIEDERTQRVAILGTVLVAVVGLGQLVDLNVDL